MSDFRDFVYVRIDPVPMSAEPPDPRRLLPSALGITRAHLSKARRENFDVHRRDAVTERISSAVAASGRPKFMKLLQKLGPKTGLVVWRLDGLGRDATDILKTIRKVHARGAEVICMDVYQDDIIQSPSTMRTLEAMSKLERSNAKTLKAASSLGRGVAGGRIGRPQSLDSETQIKVLANLKAGETVSAVARRYNTSRQTIMRMRDAQG